jgi:hypothetical protein
MENFDDYIFVVKSSILSTIPLCDLDWTGKKIVLLWTAGEFNFHPEDDVRGRFHQIFAQHHWDTDVMTSIPLGCYAKGNKKIVPMQERLFNLSFIGCMNRNRIGLASLVSKIPKILITLFGFPNHKNAKKYSEFMISLVNHIAHWMNPRDFFKFTGDFAKGFDAITYLNYLHTSKISLCPRGWQNVESFRIYESMRAGCAVITEKLPDRSYYKDIPVIQVNDWKEGLEVARDLLKDEEKLKALGEASRAFYDAKLSPEATAKIIIDKLKQKEN